MGFAYNSSYSGPSVHYNYDKGVRDDQSDGQQRWTLGIGWETIDEKAELLYGNISDTRFHIGLAGVDYYDASYFDEDNHYRELLGGMIRYDQGYSYTVLNGNPYFTPLCIGLRFSYGGQLNILTDETRSDPVSDTQSAKKHFKAELLPHVSFGPTLNIKIGTFILALNVAGQSQAVVSSIALSGSLRKVDNEPVKSFQCKKTFPHSWWGSLS